MAQHAFAGRHLCPEHLHDASGKLLRGPLPQGPRDGVVVRGHARLRHRDCRVLRRGCGMGGLWPAGPIRRVPRGPHSGKTRDNEGNRQERGPREDKLVVHGAFRARHRGCGVFRDGAFGPPRFPGKH